MSRINYYVMLFVVAVVHKSAIIHKLYITTSSVNIRPLSTLVTALKTYNDRHFESGAKLKNSYKHVALLLYQLR